MMATGKGPDNKRREGNRCVMHSFVHSEELQTGRFAGMEITS
jgi:hypothetical protein